MPSWLQDIKSSLSSSGLNVWGIADGQNYQHVLENCQSVVVIANGGRAMWTRFLLYLQEDPSRFTSSQHPLDDFVASQIKRADPNPPSSRRWIRCAETESQFLDFRPLAKAASLGHHSHMGLLIHPTYGLWVSLRAALFTTIKLPISEPLEMDNPCTQCPKYCAQGCLGEAFLGSGLDIAACARFHRSDTSCQQHCNSRLQCPVGSEHQHSIEQHHYHSSRRTGRHIIARYLGVEDPLNGIDLKW